jgi:23S rRNA (guanine745-N1)-methyltransferase
LSFDDVTTRLRCTVRGCGEILSRTGRALRCPRGHSFDMARSGYINLLGPQDRRSPRAGDSAAAVQARRRMTERGSEEWILREILAVVDGLASPRPVILDVGCGEGFHLGSISSLREVEACGVDLSVPAIHLASRRYVLPLWVVANADRFLPFDDQSFDLVLSITARLPLPEIWRVLRPEGRLLVAVAGNDDLKELRQEILGSSTEANRGHRVMGQVDESLKLLRRWEGRSSMTADPEALRDIAAMTYRGGRAGRESRLAAIGSLELTASREFLLFLR